jgi:zinc transporter ZupT
MFALVKVLFISICFFVFCLTLDTKVGNFEDEDTGVSGLEPPLDYHHDHHHDHHDHDHHDHDHHDHDHHDHDHHHHDHNHDHNLNVIKRIKTSSSSSFPVTAVLMTLASGSTAVVGGLLVVYFGVMSDRVLGHMLSFAAGVMLYISYGDILMHSIEDLDAAMSTGVEQHNHNHSEENGEDGHGHTHGPGLFYANVFLFFGMIIYICISLALKTLSNRGGGEGGESGESHGHSHMHFGSTSTTRESEHDEIIINSKSKKERKIQFEAGQEGLKQRRRRTSTAAPSIDLSSNVGKNFASSDVFGVVEDNSSSKNKSAMSAVMRQGLMWTGLNAALGIAAHNLPEGLVVYNHTIGGICEQNSASKDLLWWEFPEDPSVCLTRGVAMTFAIALHNIPEGMAVAAPIFAATESKWEAMKWCILSSLGEPIAAVLFGLLFSTGLTKFAMAAVNATTAGIMIALCLAELMPTAASLTGAQSAVISNVIGQLLMFGSIHFMRKSGVH